MIRIAIVLVLLITFPAAGESLDVMTFNIRYGTANDGPNRWVERREIVFGVLRDHAPHVVGLQEALRFQLDEIREALPGYDEIGVGRSDGATKGEYSAILYDVARVHVLESGTFWLSDTPDVPGSKSWGNSITRICTWARLRDRTDGETFYVFNVHFDHQSAPSRERSSELLGRRIHARAHGRDAVVVMGDFNTGENTTPIEYLRGVCPRAVTSEIDDAPPAMDLVDTMRAAHPGLENDGTFNGFKGERDGARIDWILVSPDVRVLESRIIRDNDGGRYPSDHFPVLARVEAGPTKPDSGE